MKREDLPTKASFPPSYSTAPSAPCTPIALSIFTGVSEEKIVELLDKHDGENWARKKGTWTWRKDGCTWSHTVKVLDELGVRYEKGDPWRVLMLHGKHVTKQATEAQFKMRFYRGTYLVRNRNHIWVIKDGVTIDPTWSNPKNSRRSHNSLRQARRLLSVYRVICFVEVLFIAASIVYLLVWCLQI